MERQSTNCQQILSLKSIRYPAFSISLEVGYRKGQTWTLSLTSTANFDDYALRSYVLYSRDLVDAFGNIRAWEKEDITRAGEPNAAGWKRLRRPRDAEKARLQ